MFLFFILISFGDAIGAVGNRAVQDFVGRRLSRTALVKQREATYKHYERSIAQNKQQDEENIFVEFFRGIKNNFAHGDVAALTLGGAWIAKLVLWKTEATEGIMKWVHRALDFVLGGGAGILFGLTRLGQWMGWNHRSAVGDKEFNKLMLKELQALSDKPILRELKDDELEKLGKRHVDTLFYPKSEHAKVMEAYASEEDRRTTLCFHGLYGLGKTAGIEYNTYMWKNLMKKKGIDGHVHYLDVSALASAQEKKMEGIKAGENVVNIAAKAASNSSSNVSFNVTNNQTLMALDILIDECDDILKDVRSHNSQRSERLTSGEPVSSIPQEKRAKIVIDEFEKSLKPELLENCDQGLAINAIKRLSDMVHEGHIYFAMNISIDELQSRLEKIVPKETAAMFASRLRERQVDLFENGYDELSNSNVIANHLLSVLPIEVLSPLGIDLNGNREHDRTELAKYLYHNVTSKEFGRVLTPRHIGSAVETVVRNLSNKAKATYASQGLNIDGWETMPIAEKAKRVDVHVTLDMLEEPFRSAQKASMKDLSYSTRSQQEREAAKGMVRSYLKEMLKDPAFIKAVKDKYRAADNVTSIDLLDCFYEKKHSDKHKRDIYSHRKLIDLDGEKYTHAIAIKYPFGDDRLEPEVRIQYGLEGCSFEDITDSMPLSEFKKLLDLELVQVMDSSGDFEKILSTFFKALTGAAKDMDGDTGALLATSLIKFALAQK